MEGGVLRFGGFELDQGTRELRRDGEVVHVEPQVFDVLAYLAVRRDRVVTKIELLDEVWGSRFVSDSALTSRIKSARQAVGDDGRAQAVIRTVHGSGYRFVAAVDGDNRPAPGPAPAPLGLAGRAFHLERLEKRLAEATNGSRRTVFVIGEAGIGKTALVEAFLEQLRDDDARVARGRCFDQGAVTEPYFPIVDALARLCRGAGGDTVVEVLATTAPSWLLQMPSLVTPDRVADLQSRSLGASSQRVQRELVEVIEALATTRPLVLVVDDLQWCDEPTLDFLEVLARRSDVANILIVGTYRLGSAGGERVPVSARRLVVEGLAEEVRLDRLDVDGVATLAAASVPGLSDDVISVLHERTAGVPLFVRDLLISWTSAGLLAPGDAGWAPTVDVLDLADTVPASVPVLVEGELARLAPDDVALLEAASIVGVEFAAAAAAAVTGVPAEDAEDRLAALARAGLFLTADGAEEWPDGTVSARFQFLHQLHHEVLYQRVPPGRKARQHIAAGERLEQAYGDQSGEHLATLALHFDRGRDAPRAIEYLGRAAEQAMARGAFPEALAHVETALAHAGRLPEGSTRDQCELGLQLARGSALIPTKGWTCSELEQAYLRARDIGAALGDTTGGRVATIALATVKEITGRHIESDSLLEPLVGADDDVMAIEMYELLACAAFHQGRFEQAIEHAAEGLARFRVDAPNEQYAQFGIEPAAYCRAWAAFASWFLGRSDDAQSHVEGLVAVEAARPYALASACALAAGFHQYRRDTERVRQWAGRAIELADERGFPFPSAEGHVLRGWARAVDGDGSGLAELEEGIAAYRASGAQADLPHYLAMEAEALSGAGRADEALARLDDALAIVARTPGYFYEPELHRLRALTLAAMGGAERRTEARRALDHALAQAEAQGSVPLRTRIAETMGQLGDA